MMSAQTKAEGYSLLMGSVYGLMRNYRPEAMQCAVTLQYIRHCICGLKEVKVKKGKAIPVLGHGGP
jgi:hypothetical protein